MTESTPAIADEHREPRGTIRVETDSLVVIVAAEDTSNAPAIRCEPMDTANGISGLDVVSQAWGFT